MNHEIAKEELQIFQYFHASLASYLHIVFKRYQHLRPSVGVQFHDFCFSEGVPQSVMSVGQNTPYLSTFLLSGKHHYIRNLNVILAFSVKGNKLTKVFTLVHVAIRVRLPGRSYFNNAYLLVANDVPVPLGLATRTRLRTITDKSFDTLRACLQKRNVAILLVITFHNLCYGHFEAN